MHTLGNCTCYELKTHSKFYNALTFQCLFPEGTVNMIISVVTDNIHFSIIAYATSKFYSTP